LASRSGMGGSRLVKAARSEAARLVEATRRETDGTRPVVLARGDIARSGA
jgi:hypothetical protein